MTKKDRTIKLIVAVIALLIAIALGVGATYAWFSISITPTIKNLTVKVPNSGIIEIALADKSQFEVATDSDGKQIIHAIGPAEVGTNDLENYGQNAWGREIHIGTESQIILQAPATFASDSQISTVRYDDTGRTDGFQPLDRGNVDENGLIYYSKAVKPGEQFLTKEGRIETATESTPGYSAAGGVALWMRSNKETSLDILLSGIQIVNSQSKKVIDLNGEDTDGDEDEDEYQNIPVGIIVRCWELIPDDKESTSSQIYREGEVEGILEERGTFDITEIGKDAKSKEASATIFADSEMGAMQPGHLYMIEILCYIEGDREKSDDALNAKSVGGREIRIGIEDGTFDAPGFIPYVSIINGVTKQYGWYKQMPKLMVSLKGTEDIPSSHVVTMHYRVFDKKTGEDIQTESYTIDKAATASEAPENSRILEPIPDGTYGVSVWMTDEIFDGAISAGKTDYYATGFSQDFTMSTDERILTMQVDTTDPELQLELTNPDGIILTDDTMYLNTDAMVTAYIREKQLRQVRFDRATVKPTVIIENQDYKVTKTYRTEGSHTAKVTVSDKARRTVEKERTFVIDKTEPEFEVVKWRFINDSVVAENLAKLTGNMFFTKMVELTGTAKDKNIAEIHVEAMDASKEVQIDEEPVITENTAVCRATVPMDFTGNVRFTAIDKAGNSAELITDLLTVSDPQIQIQVDDTDYTDAWIARGMNFRLTASGINPEYLSHFEYSLDNGANWYAETKKFGVLAVEYSQFDDNLPGSAIYLMADEGKNYSGQICFRAVTKAIDSVDYARKIYYYRVSPQSENYTFRMDRTYPEPPTIVDITGSAYDGKIVNANPLILKLKTGKIPPCGFATLEYSLNGNGWQTYDDTTGIRITEEGYTTVEVRANSKTGMISSRTNSVTAVIDRTAPEFGTLKWRFVNDSPAASLLFSLTGKQFFAKAIELETQAADAHIDKIECYPEHSSISTIDSSVISSSGTVITVKAVLPGDFKGKVSFKAIDKAGNFSTQTTDEFTVSDADLEVEATANANDWTDENVDIELKLTSGELENMDHYEYSLDGGIHWKNGDTTVNGVKIFYQTGELPGAGIRIEVPEGKSYEGNICFRVVSKLIENVDYGTGAAQLKVSPTTEPVTVQIDKTTPAAPKLLLEDGTEYDGRPVDTEKLIFVAKDGDTVPPSGVKMYQYRVNGSNWVNADGSTRMEITAEGISKLELKTISKVDRESEIAEVTTIIDRTDPVFGDITWRFVDDDPIAKLLSQLTGELLFSKKIEISVKATDIYIDKIDYDTASITGTVEMLNEAGEDETELIAKVILSPDTVGVLKLTATDQAGNTATVTTEKLTVVSEEFEVNVSGVPEGPVDEDVSLKLSLENGSDEYVTHYEYSLDGGTQWLREDSEGITYATADGGKPGSQIDIHVEENESFEKDISFRAVTKLIDGFNNGTKKVVYYVSPTKTETVIIDKTVSEP